MKKIRLICGPMATLSHEAFRRMVEKFGGCDEYFTEMINAGSLLTRGPFEKYYLLNGPVPEKIVWQITGSKTPLIAEAVKVVAPLGGIGIDLNMGCCAPEIVSSGAGLAWMLKPQEETFAMVSLVRKTLDDCNSQNNSKMRLSVKLRLGDEDFTDKIFFDFCDSLADLGVEQLTLHPRTRKQKYSRPPRWEYVQRLAERMQNKSVSVVLNGDVKDVDSAMAAINAAPLADGIMIARAAAQKPWIFAQIKSHLDEQRAPHTPTDAQLLPTAAPHASTTAQLLPTTVPHTPTDAQPLPKNAPHAPTQAQLLPTTAQLLPTTVPHAPTQAQPLPKNAPCAPTADLYQLAIDYLDDLQKYQPMEFWKTRMQRFFTYYCANFSFAHYCQTQLVNSSSIEQAKERLQEYFEKVSDDRLKKIF